MGDVLIESLERALEADPDNHEVRCHLASLLVEAERPEDALAHAERVLDAVPGHPAAAGLVRRCRTELNATRERTDTHDASLSELWEIVRPEVTLDDVAGMQEVKTRLHRSFLAPLENVELREAFGSSLRTGLLLYGPPGCGKTHLARAVAGELGVFFLSVGLPDVLDMWIGESEKNLHELFGTARQMNPSVLFIDEIDALGHKRSGFGGGAARNVVNQLLAELDGVDSDNQGVMFLAATNRPWDIDPALRRPGRFDRIMLVLPPDGEARHKILADQLDGKPTDDDLDLAPVVGATDRYSGADLVHLVETATEAALGESVDRGVVQPITQRHLLDATGQARSTTGEWFQAAKSHATFANTDGVYDDLLDYIHSRKL